MKEHLGKKVRDKVTGFEGIITAVVSYITGCDQYFVQPQVKDGAYVEGRYMDVHRVEFIEGGTKIEIYEAPQNNGADTPPKVK